jgi:hypothetical protein
MKGLKTPRDETDEICGLTLVSGSIICAAFLQDAFGKGIGLFHKHKQATPVLERYHPPVCRCTTYGYERKN